MEEEIDEPENKNGMFTSSEDFKATQSYGVDESVDSLAIEECDYIEDIKKKNDHKLRVND